MSDNRPDYVAYVVCDREDKKFTWCEIGIAFKHKDARISTFFT